jgi:hypothetical protein
VATSRAGSSQTRDQAPDKVSSSRGTPQESLAAAGPRHPPARGLTRCPPLRYSDACLEVPKSKVFCRSPGTVSKSHSLRHISKSSAHSVALKPVYLQCDLPLRLRYLLGHAAPQRLTRPPSQSQEPARGSRCYQDSRRAAQAAQRRSARDCLGTPETKLSYSRSTGSCTPSPGHARADHIKGTAARRRST